MVAAALRSVVELSQEQASSTHIWSSNSSVKVTRMPIIVWSSTARSVPADWFAHVRANHLGLGLKVYEESFNVEGLDFKLVSCLFVCK